MIASASEVPPPMPAPQTAAVATQITQTHTIRAFLAKPPRKSAELVLRTLDDDAEIVISRYEEQMDWRPSLAEEILALAEGHAQTEQVPVARLKLQFVDDQGTELKAIRVIVRSNVDASPYDSRGADLTGTSASQVIQAQKHAETMVRLMAQTTAQCMSQAKELCDQATSMAGMFAERLTAAEARVADSDARMREAMDAAQRVQSAESPEEKEEGLAKFVQIVQPLLPLVQTALSRVAPVQPPPANPA